MSNLWSSVLLSLVILVSQCDPLLAADGELEGAVDRIVATSVDPQGPGLSLLIAEHGSVLVRKSYGLASIELGVKQSPEMIYKIGSLTKQFTAAAILKLQQAGKLNLSDDLHKYLPDYPKLPQVITLEHLLNHTSGIPSFTERSDIGELEKQPLTLRQVMALFQEAPLQFRPGAEYAYSDSGYVLLAAIIEKVSGMSFAEFIAGQVTGPARLSHTLSDDPNILLFNRVPGYRLEGTLRPAQFMAMTVPTGAGNMVSNVDDLYRWNTALHSGDIIGQPQRVSMFTSGRTLSGQQTGYGFGSFIKTFAGQPVYFHDGWIFGFTSSQFYFPEADLFIVVLANSTSIDAHELASRLSAYWFDVEPTAAIKQLKWY